MKQHYKIEFQKPNRFFSFVSKRPLTIRFIALFMVFLFAFGSGLAPFSEQGVTVAKAGIIDDIPIAIEPTPTPTVSGDVTPTPSPSPTPSPTPVPNLRTPVELISVFAMNGSQSNVIVKWYVVAYTNTATGYYVDRKPLNAGEYTRLAEVAATSTQYICSYTDKTALTGISYEYRITPYYMGQDGILQLDSSQSCTTLAQTIATPKVKSAKRSKSKVKITWEKISGISGYYLYYSQNGGTYKKIKSISADKTSITLSKMPQKKDLGFKLVAYSKDGEQSAASKRSEETLVFGSAAATIQKRINKLKKQFPHKRYWNCMGKSGNNANGVTNVPCNHSTYGLRFCNEYICPTGYLGLQCYGFAWMISDKVYGKNTKYTTHKSFSKAAAGDVVRYQEHSIIIVEKHKDYVIAGECNIGNTCMIYWGRKVTKSELKGATYFHRKLK